MHPNLMGTINPDRNPAMDAAAPCIRCEAPQRQVWVPSETMPDMMMVERGDYILLLRCPECQRLWCTSPYEPYISADYTVRWYLSSEDWRTLHDRDSGRILRDWHIAAIQALYETFSPEAKAGVQVHRKRTYHSHNPIDMKVNLIPNLRGQLKHPYHRFIYFVQSLFMRR